MSNAKKPADRKKKARPIDRLRAEMGSLDIPAGELTIRGRNGKAKVTILDPFEWDAEAVAFLNSGDYFSGVLGMVSPEDAARIRLVRPSLGQLFEALLDNDEPGEPDVGESQAS